MARRPELREGCCGTSTPTGCALLLAAGALLFQGLMDWFFNYVLLRGSEPWYMLLHLTLPNALYTLILSPLLYGLTRLIAHILRKRE